VNKILNIAVNKWVASVLGAFVVGAVSTAAHAQEAYPNKPVRLVVGLLAGGPSDLLARTIALGMTEKLGRQMVVENRAGAGGIVAADHVAKSPGDGYTVMFAAMPAVVFVPLLNEKLPYNQTRDFTPVGTIASYSLFLFTGPDLPAKNIAELIALAKSKPGTLTFGSGGNGTSNHLSGELLKSLAGIDMTHVAYKGNVAAQQDVMAGRVSMMFDFLSTTQQMVKAGRLRVIGNTGATRSPFAPDVPTFKEAGLKDFDITAWFGLFVPSSTPAPVVETLNSALRATLQTADMREKLAQQGYEPMITASRDLSTRINADLGLWGPIIKKAGIKLQ